VIATLLFLPADLASWLERVCLRKLNGIGVEKVFDFVSQQPVIIGDVRTFCRSNLGLSPKRALHGGERYKRRHGAYGLGDAEPRESADVSCREGVQIGQVVRCCRWVVPKRGRWCDKMCQIPKRMRPSGVFPINNRDTVSRDQNVLRYQIGMHKAASSMRGGGLDILVGPTVKLLDGQALG